jgi:hypothetical protein
VTIDELKALDIKELKAMAYDQISLTENAQKNLQIINQVIAEKSQPKAEPKE